jgi:hypothetical protein
MEAIMDEDKRIVLALLDEWNDFILSGLRLQGRTLEVMRRLEGAPPKINNQQKEFTPFSATADEMIREVNRTHFKTDIKPWP